MYTNFFRHLAARHWLAVLFFIAGLSGAVLWFKPFTAAYNAGVFEQISTVLSTATLLVAIVIWFGEAREDWEEALPKRLKVTFLLAGQPVLISEGATLLAESDLRALAQQLGRQMNQGKDLHFSLRAETIPPLILSGPDGPERLYDVRIPLTKPPEVLLQRFQADHKPQGIRRTETADGSETAFFDLDGPAAEAIRNATA